MQAAVELGIPIINCGPGGKSGRRGQPACRPSTNWARWPTWRERYGVTLCVKAHVGQAVYNTPTTLRMMEAITSPAFGIDMDPSHIYRAGENPVEAIAAVISRVKHVHIRDCKGRQQGPGKPEDQANGRGDIDLVGYIRVLHENGYTGPLDLEIIGAKEYSRRAVLHHRRRVARAHAGVPAGLRRALKSLPIHCAAGGRPLPAAQWITGSRDRGIVPPSLSSERRNAGGNGELPALSHCVAGCGHDTIES